jgi:hypothetical protein
MEKVHIFGVKYQSPPPETGGNLSYGRFFAVFAVAIVLALAFAGCDILAKLGFGEDEGGGDSGPNITAATFIRIEPVVENATTTTLRLVFDRDIPGLKKEHVTIRLESPENEDLQVVAVESIGKTDDSPGFYTLALSGINDLEDLIFPEESFSGTLDVTVDANAIPGYRIADPSRQTLIHVVPPRRKVVFSGVETGGEENRKTTAWITFSLDPETGGLDGLEQGNVLLSVPGDANKGVTTCGDPEYSDGLWKIPVTGIDTEGTVTVTLSRNGYEFNPASIKEVPVHYAKPVELLTAAADGHEVLAQRTTKLTFTFDESVDSLGLDDIAITANGTGAAKGSISGSGKSHTLTLASNSVTKSGTIGVTVAKDGYDISNGTVQVAVYDNQYSYLATGGSVSIIQVSGVYYELHTFTYNTTSTASQYLTFTDGAPPANTNARVLVVAGGGGGGKAFNSAAFGGGGGGGGVILDTAYPLSGREYTVVVGGGGAAGTDSSTGANGDDSTFGTAFVARGGGGGGSSYDTAVGSAGGSSGGSVGGTNSTGVAPVTTQLAPDSATVTKYGNMGGGTNGRASTAGGGGGAGGAGGNATGNHVGGIGGIGVSDSITGSSVSYAGGGAAGRIATHPNNSYGAYGGSAGEDHTGDGGCGGGGNSDGTLSGTKGGSGVVIVRFPVPSAQ